MLRLFITLLSLGLLWSCVPSPGSNTKSKTDDEVTGPDQPPVTPPPFVTTTTSSTSTSTSTSTTSTSTSTSTSTTSTTTTTVIAFNNDKPILTAGWPSSNSHVSERINLQIPNYQADHVKYIVVSKTPNCLYPRYKVRVSPNGRIVLGEEFPLFAGVNKIYARFYSPNKNVIGNSVCSDVYEYTKQLRTPVLEKIANSSSSFIINNAHDLILKRHINTSLSYANAIIYKGENCQGEILEQDSLTKINEGKAELRLKEELPIGEHKISIKTNPIDGDSDLYSACSNSISLTVESEKIIEVHASSQRIITNKGRIFTLNENLDNSTSLNLTTQLLGRPAVQGWKYLVKSVYSRPCAIDLEGTLYCKLTYNSNYVPVSTDLKWKQVSASRGVLCGTTMNDELYCFSIEDPNTYYSTTPYQMKNLKKLPNPPNSKWHEVQIGNGLAIGANVQACAATKDSKMYCWDFSEDSDALGDNQIDSGHGYKLYKQTNISSEYTEFVSMQCDQGCSAIFKDENGQTRAFGPSGTLAIRKMLFLGGETYRVKSYINARYQCYINDSGSMFYKCAYGASMNFILNKDWDYIDMSYSTGAAIETHNNEVYWWSLADGMKQVIVNFRE